MLRSPAQRSKLLRSIVIVAVSAVGLSACGAVTKTTPDTVVTTTVTAGGTSTPAAQPPERPEAPAKPEVARVGDTLTLSGNEDGLRLAVKVLEVIDPVGVGQFDQPDAGNRYIGVRVRLTNAGTASYSDSPSNGAKLIDDQDEQQDGSLISGECDSDFGASTKIAPGSSRVGCLPFELNASRDPATFQFALESGFGDENGEWDISGASSSASDDAGGSSSADSGPSNAAPSSLTSCDQNIKAAPNTTCGFADNVFKRYADLLQGGDDSDSVELRASSPATGKTYSVTCLVAGPTVKCRAGDGGYVTFPQEAAAVY